METLNTGLVVKDIVLDATSQRVWEALTDKDQMREWYFNVDDFKPEVGFEFSFTSKGSKDKEYTHLCRVTQVVPSKKIQYTWTYKDLPGESFVTIELTPQGNKTRLVLTHEGLETFSANGPDFLPSSYSGGWSHIIEKSIVEYLKKNA